MDVQDASPAQTTQASAATAPTHSGVSFHDVLSALNPLQYLPVVGTIYRAVTGDVIAEPLRVLGSIAASGLMGGPIGMLINLGSTAIQKLAGIDPDQIAHQVLAAIGVVGPDPAPAPAQTEFARAWSLPAEIAPQPVTEAGEVSDTARLRQAADAYGKAHALVA